MNTNFADQGMESELATDSLADSSAQSLENARNVDTQNNSIEQVSGPFVKPTRAQSISSQVHNPPQRLPNFLVSVLSWLPVTSVRQILSELDFSRLCLFYSALGGRHSAVVDSIVFENVVFCEHEKMAGFSLQKWRSVDHVKIFLSVLDTDEEYRFRTTIVPTPGLNSTNGQCLVCLRRFMKTVTVEHGSLNNDFVKRFLTSFITQFLHDPDQDGQSNMSSLVYNLSIVGSNHSLSEEFIMIPQSSYRKYDHAPEVQLRYCTQKFASTELFRDALQLTLFENPQYLTSLELNSPSLLHDLAFLQSFSNLESLIYRCDAEKVNNASSINQLPKLRSCEIEGLVGNSLLVTGLENLQRLVITNFTLGSIIVQSLPVLKQLTILKNCRTKMAKRSRYRRWNPDIRYPPSVEIVDVDQLRTLHIDDVHFPELDHKLLLQVTELMLGASRGV